VNQGCWQGNNTENFSSLLRILTMPPKEIAFALGLRYSTYDNYKRGVANFPPDLISSLSNVTRDKRILNFFVKPCGFYLRRLREKDASTAIYHALDKIVKAVDEIDHAIGEREK